MPSSIFKPKKEAITGGWKKWLNEVFHNLYSSPNGLSMSTHWKPGMYTEFWLENLKRRNSLEITVCCKVNIRIDYRETGEAGVSD
jgi:hypothetical protein